MSQQIISVTITDTGTVDIQVRGSGLAIAQYGSILGTAVRITAGLFADTGEVEQKDAMRALLKAIQKEAHSKRDLNLSRASMQ